MKTEEIGKPGLRYRPDFERPDADIIKGFKELMERTGCLTGNVDDCLGKNAGMNTRIKCLTADAKIVGSALTVKVPPDDNLMIHKALSLIKPGDVLVIEAGGNQARALLGAIMVRIAMKHGAGGIVVDGSIRDAQEIIGLGFPVFTAGISPNGPSKKGPGEINFPVRCGGLIVHPGDLIVADYDGVLVVKKEFACEDKINQIKGLIEREKLRIKEIESGKTIRSDLLEIFKEQGLE